MNISIRPLDAEERKFAYSDPELDEPTGCIGHLRGDMGSSGKLFYTTWENHNEQLNDKPFRMEIDTVINALRGDTQFGGILKSRDEMRNYCYDHLDSGFQGNYCEEYGFRIDTDSHSYILRCNPKPGDYNFYCYCYDKHRLDDYIQQEHCEELDEPEM